MNVPCPVENLRVRVFLACDLRFLREAEVTSSFLDFSNRELGNEYEYRHKCNSRFALPTEITGHGL